jgi:glycerol-3-phosphate dehydrogenase (NAD(P)+)
LSLAIIGGGAWGTSLACVLAPRFPRVNLWVWEPGLAAAIESQRTNSAFLPGIRLPDNVHAVDTFEAALHDAEFLLSVIPSHVVREIYGKMKPWLAPGLKIISATKGLEERTLLRMSQVIHFSVSPETSVAVLSGPTFAREVAAGNPTAVVVASDDHRLVAETQQRFSGPSFRVYGSPDVTGVEIGGALKNVIAIGAGISDGLGLGHNAIAALITRGLAEITRLAVAAGARAETLSGLAGLGDLVLTCTGDLSRNRQVGRKLASGINLGEILGSTHTVAEGVKTTSVALELAARYGVDLPIASEMHAVLHLGRSPGEAIRNLMTRTLRNETGN